MKKFMKIVNIIASAMSLTTLVAITVTGLLMWIRLGSRGAAMAWWQGTGKQLGIILTIIAYVTLPFSIISTIYLNKIKEQESLERLLLADKIRNDSLNEYLRGIKVTRTKDE